MFTKNQDIWKIFLLLPDFKIWYYILICFRNIIWKFHEKKLVNFFLFSGKRGIIHAKSLEIGVIETAVVLNFKHFKAHFYLLQEKKKKKKRPFILSWLCNLKSKCFG